MTDINFIPEGEEKKQRKKNAADASVEYTSIDSDGVMPKPERHTEQPRKQKRLNPFTAWRKKQAADAPKRSTETLQPAQQQIHMAPQHQAEDVSLDLVHDDVMRIHESKVPATPVKEQPQSPPPPMAPQAVHAPVQKKRPVAEKPSAQQHIPSDTDRPGKRMGVNLVPEEHTSMLHWSAKKTLLLIAVGSVAVFVVIYVGMRIYRSRLAADLASVEQQVTAANETIVQFADVRTDADALNDDLEALSEVLDAHVYWTPFFAYIEERTLPTVYYKGMSGSALTGRFVFDMVAKDYANLDAQVGVLENDSGVVSVEVTSATQTFSGDVAGPVSTVMTVEFDMAVFHYPSIVE